MNGPRILVASICLTVFFPLARVYAGGPAATLEIQGDPVQPANAPVLLELVVHNTGPVPLSYWCGGPGDYPDAMDFVATISRTDRPSIPGRSPLSNGQQSDGPGRAFVIAPGRTLRFPAAVRAPLPPGEYDISVACDRAGRTQEDMMKVVIWPAMKSAKAFHVSAREDGRLLGARDASIVAKVRDHDPFARHVARTWPRRPVREALIKDLTGDDAVAADRAADGLWGDRPPDKSDLPLIARAIDQHLQPPADGGDVGLMTRLTRFYVGNETPELDDAIGRLAVARTDGPMERVAIERFRWTPSLGLTTPPFPDWHKVPGVPAFIDPHGVLLGTAIDLTKDPDPVERRIGFRSLVEFARDPAAAAAIRAGLKDPDETCRRLAQEANVRIPQSAATEPSALQP